MSETMLSAFAVHEIQKTLYDWREHLKKVKTLSKLFFEIECNSEVALKLKDAQMIYRPEPCRYSPGAHPGEVMVTVSDIPFEHHGCLVSDAYIRIKQFNIPAPTKTKPDATRPIFEAFLMHEQIQKTCALQNSALWW